MNQKALYTATRLFLDARMLAAEGTALPEERFAAALALTEDSAADAWLRYCCITLRSLSQTDLRTAYDFADSVHNTQYLQGLEDGLLLWPQSYWELQIEPFRAQYGQDYFSDFTGSVMPDCEVTRCLLTQSHQKKDEKRNGAIISLFRTVRRRLCAGRGHSRPDA
ncbi:MAG TPA: hypothetical protein PK537_09535 [Candidatus Limiplasma sp.]|nr:hypothetical protein [Candidatus Limiplasma sp.]